MSASPVRFGDYLSEGPGDRRFSRGVGIVVTFLALFNVLIGLLAPWLPSDAGAGDPDWALWLISIPWGLAFSWFSALQVAGLRAMYRHRDDPEEPRGDARGGT